MVIMNIGILFSFFFGVRRVTFVVTYFKVNECCQKFIFLYVLNIKSNKRFFCLKDISLKRVYDLLTLLALASIYL